MPRAKSDALNFTLRPASYIRKRGTSFFYFRVGGEGEEGAVTVALQWMEKKREKKRAEGEEKERRDY